MKVKNFIISLVLMLSLLFTAFAFTPSNVNALEVNVKVEEVDITLPAPAAGVTVYRDNASVTVKHHMTYKVVGLNWYKDYNPNGSNDKLGVDSNADTFFKGGESYTVRVDLELKGANSGWNFEYDGENTDYSGISATVNGMPAIVTHRDVNIDSKTITVMYTFENIAFGVVTPSIVIPSPIAGEAQPDVSKILCTNSRALFVADSSYNWYVSENGEWKLMGLSDKFVAGKDYKVMLGVVTQNGFRLPVESAYEQNGEKFIKGYVNGKEAAMKLTRLGYNEVSEPVYNDGGIEEISCVFTSCPAVEISSVSFSGIVAPAEGQHPVYTAPTMGDDKYTLVTDEEVTGGSQYDFVNGIQWSTVTERLNEQSVFENGKIYTLSFFVQSGDIYRFADWLEASANVGYVEAFIIDDPTLALVNIEFAPCNGGVLREIAISGVTEPVAGEHPDYDFIYSQGFNRGSADECVIWYDLTAGKALTEDDVFVYDHTYELLLVLRSDKEIYGAEGKFEFAPCSELSITINGKPVQHKSIYNNLPEANWVECSISFECAGEPVKQIAVTVENPYEGKLPASKIELNAEGCNIEEFRFYDMETLEVVDKSTPFVGARGYMLVVVLSAKEGYAFSEQISATVNGQYAVAENAVGGLITVEAFLVCEELPYFMVNFDAGEGATGHMSEVTVKGGGYYTLPECEFEASEGKTFVGWSLDGTVNAIVTGEIYVDTNITLTALWENPENHVHVYDSVYKPGDCNENEHYKLCISPNCPDLGSEVTRGEVMGHNWGNNTPCDSVCLDCGYERTTYLDGSPLHFFTHPCESTCPNCGFFREDAEDHVPGEFNCLTGQYCTVCGELVRAAEEAHTPGAAATCTQAQTCTLCGEVLEPAKDHTAGVEWIATEEGHYKLCVCGEKLEVIAHVDADGDKKCDECEFDMAKGLSTGAIIGIVAGSVVVLGGGGFCIYWFIIRKKKLSK